MKKNTKLIINIFIVVGCLLFIAGIVLLWRSGKLDPYINYFKKKQSFDKLTPVSDFEINKDTSILFDTNKVTINNIEYSISDDIIDMLYENGDYFKLFFNNNVYVAEEIKTQEINDNQYKIYQNNDKNYIFLEIEKKDKSSGRLYILLQDTNNNVNGFYLLLS